MLLHSLGDFGAIIGAKYSSKLADLLTLKLPASMLENNFQNSTLKFRVREPMQKCLNKKLPWGKKCLRKFD